MDYESSTRFKRLFYLQRGNRDRETERETKKREKECVCVCVCRGKRLLL